MNMMKKIENVEEMQRFGERLGQSLSGSEVIELVGDVGAGKTTMARGLARGMGVAEPVQSPSFTVSRVYDAPRGLRLVHYDFYRLTDAGIMASELADTLSDEKSCVVIEWADTVKDVLPQDRLTVSISSPTEASRILRLEAGGETSRRLKERVA